MPALSVLAAGCGHSEEEWQAQLDKYNRLAAEHQASQKELDDAKKKVEGLEHQLKEMGVNIEERDKKLAGLSSTLEERERALAEYKARAHQLELIKQRFEKLKKKLDELTRLGLAVSIRHNRMVISLPGDVLFDSGRDSLKKDGQEILAKVASVVKGDPQLLQRDYQVAGHTDGVALKGGTFHDNWGLSLMRARTVLLYLVGDKGGLPKEHWSAAGFADTDPVASNDSDDGKQKNRRCDLIVVPSVEEMLDLKAITQ
ncbi:Flagellar motor rotation protein MotB [Minicystis rosea]|nr:Flagellar motor rotation protein MotB [Minicystis rosea]